jgi:hypothetical protein
MRGSFAHALRIAPSLGLGLLLAVAAGGCARAPRPAYPHTDASFALERHRLTREPVSAVRAEARVDQRGKGGRIRGTVLMFVERPDRVRFDVMTQFGPAAILTSDGIAFALADLRENRYLTGTPCPANLARMLGIPLSGEEVARLLLGDSPRIAAVRQRIEVTRRGTYLVKLEGADGRRQELELSVRKEDLQARPEQQHLRLVRSEVFNASGATEWRATFDRHRVVDDPRSEFGVAMPFEVHFVHPGRNADVLVRFQRMDLNVRPPAEAFTQDPRPGIRPERVECP